MQFLPFHVICIHAYWYVTAHCPNFHTWATEQNSNFSNVAIYSTFSYIVEDLLTCFCNFCRCDVIAFEFNAEQRSMFTALSSRPTN